MARFAPSCGLKASSGDMYLRPMSFSEEELIGQLLFEGFTRSQAEYGAQTVGY